MDILTENYKLYLGDCLEVMDRLIEEGVRVDMVLTDLPYGTTKLKWDSLIDLTIFWEKLNCLIKDDTPVLMFSAQPFTTTLINSNIKKYKYDWIWQKARPSLFQHANKRPMKDHEFINVFYKKQPIYNLVNLVEKDKPTNNYRKSRMGVFLEDGCKNKAQIQTKTGYNRQIISYSLHNVGLLHPCQKPTELLEFLIKTYTNEGMIVLDCTMGSGSTGVACMNTGRKFVGIELDENYFNISINRIFENYN
jgi:site-specific DNA-methyltransferase (adenine-specific)